MTLRTLLRWIVWAAAFAVVAGVARPAQAMAPWCDERGLSAPAPAPVLPMGDVKLDVGTPLGCDDVAGFSNAPIVPRSRTQASVVDDASSDSCLRAAPLPMPGPGSQASRRPEAALVRVSPGHARGVFRPPRA